METWDEMNRLNIPESPKIGFPSFEEMDMLTVHEAYQYLCMRFVDELISAPNTFSLLHKSFLKICRPSLDNPNENNFDSISRKSDSRYGFTYI